MKQIQRFGPLLIFFLFSCSNTETKSDMEKINETVVQDTAGEKISDELMDQMISSVPSPIELSMSIQNSGAPYKAELLNPSTNIDTYSNDKARALNLGVYGLDLGYMNLYEKSVSTTEYISAINKLAGDLSVGQFFDFNLFKKLSASNNSDELIEISTNAFRSMDAFLREQKRGDISILIMTGSWIEGVYLTSQIARQNKSQELRERVGEQKIALDNLMILITLFKDNLKFKDLIKDMEDLKKTYEGVTIVNVYGKPTTKEVDGVLVIDDNSHNEISISEVQLGVITEKVKKIRESFTKIN